MSQKGVNDEVNFWHIDKYNSFLQAGTINLGV